MDITKWLARTRKNTIARPSFFAFSAVVGFLLSASVYSQVWVETYPPVSNPTDMGVRITGLGTLSDRIPYERIGGSPFWSDEWRIATLYGERANEKWLCKAKLNFATGEVHFLDKEDKEMVTGDGIVKKIVFHKLNDTSSVFAVFILNPKPVKINQEFRSSYLQVLNDGRYQLLKLIKKSLSSGDSLFGTLKRFFFTTGSYYFIRHGEIMNPVKKLDIDNIRPLVAGMSAGMDWVKEQRINFRREEDVIAFLNYFNSKNNGPQ